MKRLLTTTAVVLTLSGAAFAEQHTGAMGTVTFEQSDFYASDLIGMRIYNSETEMEANSTIQAGAEAEWDDIGEINDIIVSQDGEVRAVILGVGGFLGMGERDVSVPMESIKIVSEDGNADNRFLVVTTTKEQLEAAPAYERADANAEMTNDQSASNTDNNANAAASTETAANASTDTANTETATNADASAEKTENTDTAANASTDTTATTETAAADNASTDTTANTDTTVAANDENGLMRPTMQVDGYAETNMQENEELTAEKIEGSTVYGANDENVGEIDTLVMSEDGQVSQVVINVGGFLGIGEKPVAVDFDKIQILRSEAGDEYRFYIDSTKERLEALPEYES